MTHGKSHPTERNKEHLEFIKKRLKTTDFQAEAKLRQIDELSEIIYTARQDYLKKKK